MPETVSKLSLMGLLPAQALLAQLDGGGLAPTIDRPGLIGKWRAAHAAYTAGNPARSHIRAAEEVALPADLAARIAPFVSRASRYPPFDSHPPTVKLIPLSKLVTPQLTVNLERMRKRGTIPARATTRDLVDFMFTTSAGAPEINRQTLGMGPTGGAWIFTTYDEDVRLHQPPTFQPLPMNSDDTEAPKLGTICFPIGGGTPFPYAFRVPILPGVNRLILANGIHRAAAAARAGVERVPLLVIDFQQVEVPDPFVETPRGILLDPTQNAATVADFANPALSIELEYYRQLRTVRFNWNFENYLLSVH